MSIVKREMYMSRIRPFIGSELIKVITGIRRSGKSVMLELIKEELSSSGTNAEQFIYINFEDMRYASLCTAEALHDDIIQKAASINGKVYLFLIKFRKYKLGEVYQLFSCRVSLLFILFFFRIFRFVP